MTGAGAGAESEEVRCMLMRGGTSKGAYFLAGDLPAEPAPRDDLLLRVMGSPDPRQIDGLGGAHPDQQSCGGIRLDRTRGGRRLPVPPSRRRHT